MSASPYDENWNLDMLAVETQLNSPQTMSIIAPAVASKSLTCGGCGAELVASKVDDVGRDVRDFSCGHRYVIGRRTVSIERAHLQ